jgi:hypothetical protein
MGDRPVTRHRVFIEDARRNGCYLRATWHPERRVFVLSTWSGDVCTGAIRLPAADAADLVGLVADGLAELAVPPPAPAEAAAAAPAAGRVAPTRWAALRRRVARWLDDGPDDAPPVRPLPAPPSRPAAGTRRSA